MTQEVEALGSLGVELPNQSGRGRAGRALAPWLQRPMALVGAIIIVVVLLVAVLAPIIAPYDPRQFAGGRLESPNSEFFLGTNNVGQDTLSRTIYGAQVSIAVGLSAATIAVFLGTFFGIISGYVGGWVDILIQRGLEVLASFPAIVLALIMVTALGRPTESGSNLFVIMWQLKSLEIAIAMAFVFGNMRIVRSAVLKERNLPYIEAAVCIGCPPSRILLKHILPNVMPYVIVSFSIIIGIAILVEASLSFLGYGVSITTPSWGIDLSQRNREYFVEAPWLLLAPGAALSLTVLGFNFLGDGLRDILDPRLRGSR